MFVIRSYHADAQGAQRRVHFWQTPWVVLCDPYISTNDYGEVVTLSSRMVGGWVTFSGIATQYASHDEAVSVSAIRGLHGEVVDATRYLTTTP